jgi:hypothetical protein
MSVASQTERPQVSIFNDPRTRSLIVQALLLIALFWEAGTQLFLPVFLRDDGGRIVKTKKKERWDDHWQQVSARTDRCRSAGLPGCFAAGDGATAALGLGRR